MWDLDENRVPDFHSYDSYGGFSVIIDGKVYRFENTDAAAHDRWRRMLISKNPKTRWKAFREIKMSSKPMQTQPKINPQKQLTFRNWMRTEGLAEMALVGFGKHKGQKPEQVPAGYWAWLRKQMQENPGGRLPNITDDDGRRLSDDEIRNYIGMSTQPPPQQAMPQQQGQQTQRNWILARKNDDKQPVVMSKRPDNNWDMMDQQGNIQVVPMSNIRSLVTSERDDEGGTIQSGNPDELFQMSQQNQPTQIKDQITQREQTIKTGRNGESIEIPRESMSQYNLAIEDRFANSADPIMINALAGTGKTTMLKHLSSFIQPGERWLYLVFNKKNQVEASQEFPDGVDVLTTHSYLGRVLKANGKNVGGNTNLPPREVKWTKTNKLLDELVPRNDQTFGKFRWGAVARIKKITSLAKAFAINPNSQNLQQELMNLIDKYGIDMDLSTERIIQDRDYTPDMLQKVQQLLQISLPGQLPSKFGNQFADIRDQDDTLWFAAINADNIRWNANPHYDVVLMDEVQDFNQCQLMMANKLKESGARLVGVGDPNQAMYLFRGASADAFDQLGDIITGGQSDPMDLPINFRSDPKVIEFAKENTHVKDLQANPKLDPNAGEATTHIGYNDFMSGIQDEYGKDKKLEMPTAFIARTNAPLASTAMSLLKNNVDFQILGRDLSQELKKHIKKVTWAKPQNYDISDLSDLFFDYFADVQQKWGQKVSKQDELKEIEQTTDALTSVLQHLGEQGWREDENGPELRTGMDFLGFIDRKLGGLDPDNERDSQKLKQKDPNSYVTLTTAHKSKGLEWGKVFIVKPDQFSDSKPNIKTAEEAQQERNAWFVAITRAKHSINVSADDKP